MTLSFGTGQVANALGMQGQALGNLCRELMPGKPPNRHHRFTHAEVLWLACYRHARAAGLEAFPAKTFLGSPRMHAMLEALLAYAAPDPAEAVKRLRNVPIMYGARFNFAEARDEAQLVGEPLLFEAQRLPDKLTEPCIAAGGAGFAQLTVFLMPLEPPLRTLQRVIEESRDAS